MIDQQKMVARISDIEAAGVAVSNYGLALSALQSSAALNRVLDPWNLKF